MEDKDTDFDVSEDGIIFSIFPGNALVMMVIWGLGMVLIAAILYKFGLISLT